MKKIGLFSFIVVTLMVSLIGCNLGGSSNYTPQVSLYRYAFHGLKQDSTLELSYTLEGNLKTDTLHVNDTVTIIVVGDGFANSLKKLDINVTQAGDIEIIAPHDSVKRFFDPTSDYVGGKIVFTENTARMSYPFQFVTLKPRDNIKIDFQLTSDAKEVGNISSLRLEVPVKQ